MPVIFKAVGENLHSQELLYESQHENIERSVRFQETSQTADDCHSHGADSNGAKQDAPEQAIKDDLSPSRRESMVGPSWAQKIQRRVPRIYYITTELILPLLILIGLSFLFGYGLARIESTGEIETNDQIVGDNLFYYWVHIFERAAIWSTMGTAATSCLADIVDNHENGTQVEQLFPEVNITQHMFDCPADLGMEYFIIMEPLEFLGSAPLGLTFDWTTCPTSLDESDANSTSTFNFTPAVFERMGLNPKDSHDRQLLAYLIHFITDMSHVVQKLGYTEDEAFSNMELMLDVSSQATGSRGCGAHVAGGALFWFTIMTTIGYGNTAPTTDEGRILVYTAGFLTIIGFLTLNNTAANVWKVLAEDVFLRLKWKRLVSGPLSVLFWLCATILWILVIALSVMTYRRKRIGDDFPLKDAYWFSYITTTTVGFGDIHISHEEFTVGDMFFVPLIILMGFNFLGIFAEKAVDLYNEYFPARHGFHHVLAEQRGETPMGDYSRSMRYDRSRLRHARTRQSDRSEGDDMANVIEAEIDC